MNIAPAPAAVMHFHPREGAPVVARGEIDPALLAAHPRGLMIEYTSRCNLRCKYCSKSNPGDDDIPGRDMDMPAQTIEQVLALVASQPVHELLLAGTGESTFHKDWMTDIPRLIAAGKAANKDCFVHINSNLALKYGDAEFAVLAQLDGIMVSIDTADRELTRSVRAKSDLALISYNLVRLRSWCSSRGLRAPRLSINATVFAEAAHGIYDLVVMLSQLPIDHLTLSDLIEFEAVHINGIRPLSLDDRSAFVESVQVLQQAINYAQAQRKFTLTVQPHLLERINALIAQLNAGGATAGPSNVPEPVGPGRRTKLCIQPWTRFTVAADGAIFPCCVTDMPPVGHVGREGEGIDGPVIRAFRRALLQGQVPPACERCSNARSCDTTELDSAVRALSLPRQ
jgi:MoaA/NifB/PqqE/SkfB family radical SAM enzyme